MTDEPRPNPDLKQPMVYQIRVKGHLRPQWITRFEGLSITLEENGNTLLSGPVVDQSALYGILKIIRDLSMPLLSVNSVDAGKQDASDNKQVTHE